MTALRELTTPGSGGDLVGTQDGLARGQGIPAQGVRSAGPRPGRRDRFAPQAEYVRDQVAGRARGRVRRAVPDRPQRPVQVQFGYLDPGEAAGREVVGDG